MTLGSGGNVTLGSGGNITLGSGGATTNELTYNTANSIVRPPSSPGYTTTSAGVVITWNAPAFGVVQTYTIYRSGQWRDARRNWQRKRSERKPAGDDIYRHKSCSRNRGLHHNDHPGSGSQWFATPESTVAASGDEE